MPDYDLLLHRSPYSNLDIYTNTDWASCQDTRRSTSDYVVFLGDNLVSWSAKRQTAVSQSIAEVEYRAVANSVADATWLRQLLHVFQSLPSRYTLVYCDNINIVHLSTNLIQYQLTKNVEIDLHFIIREKVIIGQVRVLHVPTTLQFTDIFMKSLPTTVFTEFRSSLNIWSGWIVTAEGVRSIMLY
jgi:hypothetical protein